MVFNRIISTARKPLGNQSPSIAQSTINLDILFMRFDDSSVLFLSPSLLLDIRIKMVMPSLATLLADPTRQMLGYVSPIFSAMFQD